MSTNPNPYDMDIHVAELYDRHITETDDIDCLLRLLEGRGPLRILEPFCGTGRILIPLARAGHQVVGLDAAQHMLGQANRKIAELPDQVRRRIELRHVDVTASGWPGDFDVVLLASNCLYELATAAEQQAVVAAAATAVSPGGYVYLDNDHMEGELDPNWRHIGQPGKGFPCGTTDDGSRVEATSETLWVDVPNRLWKARRRLTVTSPDGTTRRREWTVRKHPCSFDEVTAWVSDNGLAIEAAFGDHNDTPYASDLSRLVIWAHKPGENE